MPNNAQFPITVDTPSGKCTVVRLRQLYQHLELQLTWHDTGGVDKTWASLAENCEDGFEISDYDRSPEPVKRLVRQVVGAWLDNWFNVRGY